MSEITNSPEENPPAPPAVVAPEETVPVAVETVETPPEIVAAAVEAVPAAVEAVPAAVEVPELSEDVLKAALESEGDSGPLFVPPPTEAKDAPGEAARLLAEAREIISQRLWDDAIPRLRAVLKENENFDEARRELIRCYAVRGQIEKVIKQYYRMVAAMEERGEMALAEQTALDLLKLHPTDHIMRQWQVEQAKRRGDKDQIVDLSLDLAAIYQSHWNMDKMIELLVALQQDYPQNAKIEMQLAEAHIANGDVVAGASIYSAIATRHLNEGRQEEAIEPLVRMKRVMPNDERLHFTLGHIFLNLGRFDEAEVEFRSILKINLDHVGALLAIGNLTEHKGNIRNAALAYSKVIALDPSQTMAWDRMGEIFDAEGKKEEAIKHYLMAAQRHMATAVGQERAAAIYNRVLALDPENVTAKARLPNIKLQA